jgi:hypothetical protein
MIALSAQAEISGTVRSAAGPPISGALVVNLSIWLPHVYERTSQDGRFRVPGDAPSVLLIDQDGYQPVIRRHDPKDGELAVTLAPEGPVRVLPVCRHDHALAHPEIKIKLPRGAQHCGDIDFSCRAIPFKSGSSKAFMSVMSGVTIGGLPTWIPVDGLVRLEVTSFRMVGIRGLDFRWVRTDGRRSRLFGYGLSNAWYDEVPPEAAAYFDSLIDRACVRSPTTWR